MAKSSCFIFTKKFFLKKGIIHVMENIIQSKNIEKFL